MKYCELFDTNPIGVSFGLVLPSAGNSTVTVDMLLLLAMEGALGVLLTTTTHSLNLSLVKSVPWQSEDFCCGRWHKAVLESNLISSTNTTNIKAHIASGIARIWWQTTPGSDTF